MGKQILSVFLFLFAALQANSQNDSIFNRTIYNNEENIYLVMNFYENNITVKDQEFMGEMSGYLGDFKDFRKWFILDAEIINQNTAHLSITNDEGSEDLTATLIYNPEAQTYTLKQEEGSPLRTARNRKWHKLPKNIIYTKTKE